MLKIIIWVAPLLVLSAVFGSSPPIVFVYLGSQIPSYHADSLHQARIFNRSSDIFLIGNRKGLSIFSKGREHELKAWKVQLVEAESLALSREHLNFRFFRDFNPYVERFFYVDALTVARNLVDVFYLESDVMLYADLSEYLGLFHKHYPGMGAALKNDLEGSVSFLYFAASHATRDFVRFTSHCNDGDMWLIARYMRERSRKEIDFLPIISRQYVENNSLFDKIYAGAPLDAWRYCNHVEEFGSLFDPDLFGPYLHEKDATSMVPAVIRVCRLVFKWVMDERGRRVPYAGYAVDPREEPIYYRINHLHVAPCDLSRKKLYLFSSIHGSDLFQVDKGTFCE